MGLEQGKMSPFSLKTTAGTGFSLDKDAGRVGVRADLHKWRRASVISDDHAGAS